MQGDAGGCGGMQGDAGGCRGMRGDARGCGGMRGDAGGCGGMQMVSITSLIEYMKNYYCHFMPCF